MKQRILLFGPRINNKKGSYGGGTGGFTRNMSAYLNFFKGEQFEIVPSFHTIRGASKLDFFVIRFFRDAFSFFADLISKKPHGVHILAQYRMAIPREFMVVIFSKLFGKPILYEIKAGAFMNWYKSTNPIFRKMMDFVLSNSKVVLSEGIPYLSFLKDQFDIEAHYFPNYVPSNEVPEQVPNKLSEETIKLLFVGYAYKDKGVFELVEGCNRAAQNVKVELTLIGKESEPFTEWLDKMTLNESFKINRLGVKPHDFVLDYFNKVDVYCYPTRHGGEGHNNSINEAMMMGLVIITTRQGFLGTVLSDDRAYFLNEISPAEISKTINQIHADRDGSQRKAINSRKHLIENFTSKIAYEKLNNHYKVLTAHE